MANSLGLSEDELIAYLSQSRLPTLLVEGSGDEGLIRRIEKAISNGAIDILPVGGKGPLHAVYERRGELGNARVAFLRDQDEFVVLGIPPGHEDYIFTSGYSIENDLLNKPVLQMLAGEDAFRLSTFVSLVSDWFRHALSNNFADPTKSVSKDVSQVLCATGYTPEATAEMAGVLHADCAALDAAECWSWLRGKTLLRTIHHFFLESAQPYSKAQLIDVSLNMGRSPAFTRLADQIQLRLAI